MPDLYSSVLTASICLVGIAFVVAALFRLGALGWRWQSEIRSAALTGLALDLAAALIHLRAGHRPGTPAALGWSEFFAEHSVLLVVAVGGLSALWLSAWRRGA